MKKQNGRGVQVRLNADLVRKAKFVANTYGKTLQMYLHEKLAYSVDAEFRKAIRRSSVSSPGSSDGEGAGEQHDS